MVIVHPLIDLCSGLQFLFEKSRAPPWLKYFYSVLCNSKFKIKSQEYFFVNILNEYSKLFSNANNHINFFPSNFASKLKDLIVCKKFSEVILAIKR